MKNKGAPDTAPKAPVVKLPPIGVQERGQVFDRATALEYFFNVLDQDYRKTCIRTKQLLAECAQFEYQKVARPGDQDKRYMTLYEQLVGGGCSCGHLYTAHGNHPVYVPVPDLEAIQKMQQERRAFLTACIKAAETAQDQNVLQHLCIDQANRYVGMEISPDGSKMSLVYTEDAMNRFNPKKRRHTKPVRLLREYYINAGFSEKDAEDFVYRLQAVSGMMIGTYTMYTGNEVMKKYMEGEGTPLESCMTKGERNAALSLYAANPTKVALLMLQHNSFKARAIVWYTDQGTLLLDRIYPNQGWHIAMMQNWIFANGGYVRNHHSAPQHSTWPSSEGFMDKDRERYTEFTITLTAPKTKSKSGAPLMPYLDSFTGGIVSSDLSRLLLSDNPYGYASDMAVVVAARAYDMTNAMTVRCQSCAAQMQAHNLRENEWQELEVDGVKTYICHRCKTKPKCNFCAKPFTSILENENWLLSRPRGRKIQNCMCGECRKKYDKTEGGMNFIRPAAGRVVEYLHGGNELSEPPESIQETLERALRMAAMGGVLTAPAAPQAPQPQGFVDEPPPQVDTTGPAVHVVSMEAQIEPGDPVWVLPNGRASSIGQGMPHGTVLQEVGPHRYLAVETPRGATQLWHEEDGPAISEESLAELRELGRQYARRQNEAILNALTQPGTGPLQPASYVPGLTPPVTRVVRDPEQYMTLNAWTESQPNRAINMNDWEAGTPAEGDMQALAGGPAGRLWVPENDGPPTTHRAPIADRDMTIDPEEGAF